MNGSGVTLPEIRWSNLRSRNAHGVPLVKLLISDVHHSLWLQTFRHNAHVFLISPLKSGVYRQLDVLSIWANYLTFKRAL